MRLTPTVLPQEFVTSPQPQLSSAIGGSVLPLARAEELIGSLTDVVSARISAAENGSIDTIHVLVTGDVSLPLR